MGAEESIEVTKFFLTTTTVLFAIQRISDNILLITKMPNGQPSKNGYIVAKAFAFIASLAVCILMTTYASQF